MLHNSRDANDTVFDYIEKHNSITTDVLEHTTPKNQKMFTINFVTKHFYVQFLYEDCAGYRQSIEAAQILAIGRKLSEFTKPAIAALHPNFINKTNWE